jgi:hypothetical protein
MSEPFVFVLTAVNDPVLDRSVLVYPNPVSRRLIIRNNGLSRRLQVRLLDINGKELYRTTTLQGTTQVPVQHLSAGFYVLQVLDLQTGKRIQRMIRKEHE